MSYPLVHEFRILVPLDLEEFNIGFNYGIMKASEQVASRSTGGSKEGVEWIRVSLYVVCLVVSRPLHTAVYDPPLWLTSRRTRSTITQAALRGPRRSLAQCRPRTRDSTQRSATLSAARSRKW